MKDKNNSDEENILSHENVLATCVWRNRSSKPTSSFLADP
jgi:hypothetical protein